VEKGAESEGERPEADGFGEGSSSTSSAKRRKLDTRQEGDNESCAKGSGLAIAHIPSTNRSSSIRVRSDKSLHATSQHPQHLDTFLVDVSIKNGTCIPIAVAAIVGDHKRDCPSSDVRAEHLDFEKLLAIVSATDDSWDSQACKMRWDEDEQQICDDEDFTNAIGVMHFRLEKLRLEKPGIKKPESSDDV